MSFQHFRLGDLALSQSSPPVAHYQHTIQQDQNKPLLSSASHTKQPYGSGDTDDGYTLIFTNLAAFQEWRAEEEERQMVEFVKGDTHGSKAIPPRFKDHTKLVCARHSRSGRKKYVKKHPERVRKVPSRKLEGIGCPASISYKTYFDSDEVRACYMSQHSHPIGLANLPFTRRGRKAAALQEKERRNRTANASSDDTQTSAPPPATEASTTHQNVTPQTTVEPPPSAVPTASTSTAFTSTESIVASHTAPNAFQQTPSNPYAYSNAIPAQNFIHSQNLSHDRWENMATLFQSIRENARTFEYPSVSIAALESILIRLYLESPMVFAPQPAMGAVVQHLAGQARAQSSSGENNDVVGNGVGEEGSRA
ncbi:hypothetical protein AX15_001592 [Amanita polypyramis BW_CC]|nr:hypothetical protein AX15_001592 [Amanita polypyramis BW_CC]